MRRERKPHNWEDDLRSDRAYARAVGWSAARWFITIFVGALLLSGLIWGITVLVSGPKGAGDAQIIKNDGRNRVNAQEEFHSIYNKIIATDQQITISATELAAATAAKNADDVKHWRSTLTGQRNVCVGAVGEYNAKTDQFSRGQWRDPVLPYKIDQADPATDCQPAQVTATAAPTN